MRYESHNLTVFENCRNQLGEGIAWHPVRESVMWLDISNHLFFEKRLFSPEGVNCQKLDICTTAVSATSTEDIWLVTVEGIVRFNPDTSLWQTIGNFALPAKMRTNDGGPHADGRYWFGSMENEPSGANGALYSVGPGGDYRLEMEAVGIPNTFVTIEDSGLMYVSDSYKKEIYTLESSTGRLASFHCFHTEQCTPDGGALDSLGNLWIALWDGYAVKCLSRNGGELHSIELPVPRPTKCCFGGADLKTLYISTASEGLDDNALDNYPLSGSVFSVDLNVVGYSPPTFGA